MLDALKGLGRRRPSRELVRGKIEALLVEVPREKTANEVRSTPET
jgi:hypothetical protein